MSINKEANIKLNNTLSNIGTQIHNYFDDLFEIIKKHGVDGIETPEKHYENSAMYGKSDKWENWNSHSTPRQARNVLSATGIFEHKFLKVETKDDLVNEITRSFSEVLKKRSVHSIPLRNQGEDRAYISMIIFFWEKLAKEKEINTEEIFSSEDRTRKYFITKNNWFKFEELWELLKAASKNIFDLYEFNLEKKYYEPGIISQPSEIYENTLIEEQKEKLETSVVSFYEIIKDLNKSNKLAIPFYQRDYVWSENLVLKLLDASYSEEKFTNFGILLQNSDLLLDGQQRVTTMCLLYMAISKMILKSEEDKKFISLEYKDIFTTNELAFLENMASGKFSDFIVNDSNDEYVKQLKSAEKLNINEYGKNTFATKLGEIGKNYKKILEFLHILIGKFSNNREFELKELVSFYQSTKTFFVTIVKDAVSDPVKLFINTNNNRVLLGVYDLVKAFLFSNGKKYKWFNEKIKSLDSILNDDKIKQYQTPILKLFITYEELLDPSKEKIKESEAFLKYSRFFADDVSYEEGLKNHIDKLIDFIEYYKYIKGIITKENIILFDFLKTLTTKKTEIGIYEPFLIHFVSILFKCEEEYNDGALSKKNYLLILNNFRKCLFLVEKFNFTWKIFFMTGQSYGNVQKNLEEFIPVLDELFTNKQYSNIYSSFVNVIKSNKTNIMYEYLYNYDVTLDKIKSAFDDLDNKTKSVEIQADILIRVPFNLHNDGIEISMLEDNQFNISNPSVEHIYPQNDTKWLEEDSKNTGELRKYLEDIGNKFILDRSKNSSASNEIFKTKLSEVYKGQNIIELDKTLNFEDKKGKFNILNLKKWDINCINRRREQIAKDLIEIWREI